jgi:uncharacterized protein YceH (UPF0502 family)
VQQDVDNGVKLLPGNEAFEARPSGDPPHLEARIAELEWQLAELRRMLTGHTTGQGRPQRRGK